MSCRPEQTDISAGAPAGFHYARKPLPAQHGRHHDHIDGYVARAKNMSRSICDSCAPGTAARRWVHCYAGISRSTAGAFVTKCTHPQRDEMKIA